MDATFRRQAQRKTSSRSFVLLTFIIAHSARADNFSEVTYDGRNDEIVITMRYLGTNPDHIFSLRWGQCKKAAGSRLHEIVVEVLDGQWQDEERTDYTKTTRFGLTDLSCRPAALTLRTAPRFFYVLFIPAADVRGPECFAHPCREGQRR